MEEPAVKGRNTPLKTAKTARKRCRGNEEKSCALAAYCCRLTL